MGIKLLTVAAKTPVWLHPVCFNPLMRYHLAKLDFDMKWAFNWRDEFNNQLRLTSGYDLSIDGEYRKDELYLCGVHRHFIKGYIKGHHSFCVHKSALIVSWDNPYNWHMKYQAYKALVVARVKQDITVSASWKHTLNGILWGSLITLGVIL